MNSGKTRLGTQSTLLFTRLSFFTVHFDWTTTVMDGLTLLNRLHQNSFTVPVIVISADPTRSPMIKAIEGGARDYLFKPISGEILKRKCLRFFL